MSQLDVEKRWRSWAQSGEFSGQTKQTWVFVPSPRVMCACLHKGWRGQGRDRARPATLGKGPVEVLSHSPQRCRAVGDHLVRAHTQ